METTEFQTVPAAAAGNGSPEAKAIDLTPLPGESRLEQVQRLAQLAYLKHRDWINFFREVLGNDGIVRKMFATPEEVAAFEKTAEYAAIQQMLTKLREQSDDSSENEPTRVITVRLPKSLHEALKSEAHEHRTSMNQLCISKLLKLIEKEFIPKS
jgi:predicted HicB family RNase H-like nuclease